MEEIFKLYWELRGLFDGNDPVAEFCRQIHHIIQDTIDRIPDGTRIAIRPAGGETKEILGLYDFSQKNVVGIVDREYRGDDYYGYSCYTADSFPTELCDCVIISSHDYRQEIKEELETLHIPYIDFYDELEKRGVQLSVAYYLYELYSQLAVNYFYLRYLRSEAGPKREAELNTLLQIAVEYKDFTLISNIYQDCGGENGKFPLLKAVWEKSKQLLDRIQSKLQERKQKDIILFWTDAVRYDMLHYLPETMKLSKQGVFFQRSYTNVPYTNSVLRAMFCKILPIDNFPQTQEKIGSGNSSLIRFMENEGYKVRFIGDSKRAMGKEHLLEIKEFEPCSAKWWKGIVDLLQSPEPCFYIFHFWESHVPFYVPDMKEIDLHMETKTRREDWCKPAYGYLDQCLQLYHKLLGNKVQIFFSDHGPGALVTTMNRFGDQSIHPYCFVVGENIPKITITRFFPYTNFEQFVRWIVDPAHFSLDDACTDEVHIQDVDFYSLEHVDFFIRNNREKYGLAFRGIINYDYKYVINSLGEEFFYEMQQDGSEMLVPLEDPALRAELREKAGTKFLDIYQYDKFRYTRKLYDSINQKRCGGNTT